MIEATYWQSHLRKYVSVDLSINVNSLVRREPTRVADDGGAGGLKLLERGRHDGACQDIEIARDSWI